jgi:putative transposase
MAVAIPNCLINGQFLIKELNAGQVVVMDNASFHKSPRSKELIEWLPANILTTLFQSEKFWANMKRWIKSKITEFGTLYETITHFFATPNTI